MQPNIFRYQEEWGAQPNCFEIPETFRTLLTVRLEELFIVGGIKMKRWLLKPTAILLTVITVLSMVPVMAFAITEPAQKEETYQIDTPEEQIVSNSGWLVT